MSILPKKTFDVFERQLNGNIAEVTCKIPKFTAIKNNVQIGEFISTELFALVFNGIVSKWKLIFYPKGQYDFGIASEDCRLYIKLHSCEEEDAVQMEIDAYVMLLASPSKSLSIHSSSRGNKAIFITNDSKRNWAGPFIMQPFEEDQDDNRCDNLTLKVTFKLIPNEKNDWKRSFSEVASPTSLEPPLQLRSSKRSRLLSPLLDDKVHTVANPMDNNQVQLLDHNVAEQLCTPMEVDVYIRKDAKRHTKNDERNPFTTKSPVTRLSTSDQSLQDKPCEQNIQTKECFVSLQREKFKLRTSRASIFTPEERRNLRGFQKASSSSHSSLNGNHSQPFKSSRCLRPSDINGRGLHGHENTVRDAQSRTEEQVDLISEDESSDEISKTIKKMSKSFSRRSLNQSDQSISSAQL